MPHDALARARRAAVRAAGHPWTRAALLGTDAAALAERLGISERAALRLLLCAAPRQERRQADLDALAAYAGCDVGRLDRAIREAHPA